MNKFIKLGCLAILALMLAASSMSAQKVGYINSLALLSEMPEVRAANSRLESLEKQLVKQGEGMVAKLQNKLKAAEEQHARGELTAQEIAKLQTDLQQEELEIMKFEQKAQEDLAKKRDELFQPILEKVGSAVEGIAKSSGYSYVFDTGGNVMLYADESIDITSLVKSKLGM